MSLRLLALLSLTVLAGGATAACAGPAPSEETARIERVVDGDTVVLTNGQRVRLVQIDTPEVFSSSECFGMQASAATSRLLPPRTEVRLVVEPATDEVDQYGRLLRYIVRVSDGLNVNVQLVRAGDAAPYFYAHRRGRYASLLEKLAREARAKHLGLWGACPHTPYDPNRAVSATA